MIFDAYTFFKPIVEAHADLTGIYSCSGYAGMEDVISNIRSTSYPIAVVEDAPDCTLSISEKPGTDQHLSLYIICKGGRSGAERSAAFNQAATLGEELLRELKDEIRSQEGFDGLKLDEDNITMQRIGPTVKEGYGYIFSYSL